MGRQAVGVTLPAHPSVRAHTWGGQGAEQNLFKEWDWWVAGAALSLLPTPQTFIKIG